MVCLSNSTFAIVFHPDTEPNLVQWIDRPEPNIVGKWVQNPLNTNGRGSCVAIAPRYVLTTTHQGGNKYNSTVKIGGITYNIAEIIAHPLVIPYPSYPDNDTVDLRLIKLENADLEDYIPINSSEEFIDANIVIAGFGLGRGCELGEIVYGYGWKNRYDVNNTNIQRWATNRADEIWKNVIASDKYLLDLLIADFDGTDPNIDDPNVTDYEGTVAEFDSGGGWFIKDSNQWKLAALTFGVDHGDISQSWFRSNSDPCSAEPDKLYGILISSYAQWILDNIAVEADFNNDYHVNFYDLAEFAQHWGRTDCKRNNSWCDGFDFDESGYIDFADLDYITQRWLNNE